MSNLTVAACSLNQTPLDWSGNAERIRRAMTAARERKVDVLALPELALSGCGCEDMFLFRETWDKSLEMLFALLPETKGIVTTLGLPLRVGGSTFNAVAIVADGDLLGFVCKQYNGFSGTSYDARWFAAWPTHSRFELDLGGTAYPVGDLTFLFDGVRLGVEFCDLTNDETDKNGDTLSGTLLEAERNCGLVINPSVSGFQLDKYSRRREMLRRRSATLNSVYVSANLVGVESGGAIYDGGAMVALCGKTQAETCRFSFDDLQLALATVDMNAVTSGESLTKVVSDSQAGMTCQTENGIVAPVAGTSDAMFEEFGRAVSLGLLDYMRKTQAGGLTLSLSGGADSGALATLVWLGVRFGVHELGFDAFLKRFDRVKNINAAESPDDIMSRLLTTVYQGTQNSSETTHKAAKSLAQTIGATFYEFDIEPIVRAYSQMVEQQIGRMLSWDTDDLAMQNIQARVRVPGVWYLANLSNSLLLSTGNRSETAVGYATMDGDTCGGLSPISGIDKHFLRGWLRWMQTTGATVAQGERLPLPVLQWINDQQPTAELRPQSAAQTDESDLMPYEVLNRIEGWFVRDRLSQTEILARLEQAYADQNREQLLAWLHRFNTLWRRNQWKREKSSPGFHLDEYNLSPRSFFRFPIISGPYRFE